MRHIGASASTTRLQHNTAAAVCEGDAERGGGGWPHGAKTVHERGALFLLFGLLLLLYAKLLLMLFLWYSEYKENSQG